MQRRRVGIIYPLTIASDRGNNVVSDAVTERTEGVQQRIRDLAYLMWESAGRPHGMAMQYWLAAEKEVLGIMQAAYEDGGGQTTRERAGGGEAG